jgi:hypothetical protein
MTEEEEEVIAKAEDCLSTISKDDDLLASTTTSGYRNKKHFLTDVEAVVEENSSPLLLDDPNDPDHEPEIHTPRPRSTMVKISRSLEQKRQIIRETSSSSSSSSSLPEEECPESTGSSTSHPGEAAVSQKKKDRVRHVSIQVNGQWGYYSGPKIIIEEAEQLLRGCVVRFTNGDLYVGSIQKGQFHGTGSFYPIQGSIQRGRFGNGELLVSTITE